MGENDGFDWGGQPSNQQGMPQPQDNAAWGASSGGMWGQTSGVDNGAWDAPQSDDVWDGGGAEQTWTDPTGGDQNWQNQSGEQPLQEVGGGRGQKAPMPVPVLIGIVVALLVVVALIMMALANTGVKKKTSQPQPTQAVQQTQSSQGSQHSQVGGASASKDGSILLTKIPDNTALNYSGDVLQTTGTVGSKVRYLMDNQVVYCIELKVAVGSASQTIYFYCNYATYASVSTGDLVSVQYQQVQDNFISVNSVTK